MFFKIFYFGAAFLFKALKSPYIHINLCIDIRWWLHATESLLLDTQRRSRKSIAHYDRWKTRLLERVLFGIGTKNPV